MRLFWVFFNPCGTFKRWLFNQLSKSLWTWWKNDLLWIAWFINTIFGDVVCFHKTVGLLLQSFTSRGDSCGGACICFECPTGRRPQEKPIACREATRGQGRLGVPAETVAPWFGFRYRSWTKMDGFFWSIRTSTSHKNWFTKSDDWLTSHHFFILCFFFPPLLSHVPLPPSPLLPSSCIVSPTRHTNCSNSLFQGSRRLIVWWLPCLSACCRSASRPVSCLVALRLH